MKITLISFEQLITALGVRTLSALLKSQGNDVSIIFMRAHGGEIFSDRLINQTMEICKNSDIVGMSFMTCNYLQAVQLTKAIKKNLNSKVIFGGIHPTFSAEECLKYADAVCIGEGDISFIELCNKIKNGAKFTDTKGFWFNQNSQTIKNETSPLVSNLDSLPTHDYGLEGHYVRDNDTIKQMDKCLFLKCLTKRKLLSGECVPEYYISTSRGCPYKCSYCTSNSIKKLYPGQKFYRFRSIEKVIDDVLVLLNKFDFIKFIYFADDDIFSCPIEMLKEFSPLWRKKVGLPFYCTSTPWAYNEEKMKLLVDAGLMYINVGIQTVSARGSTVFNRKTPKQRYYQIVKSLKQYKTIAPPEYDFIIDNPYETIEDNLENLRFIHEIPEPFHIKAFSLRPYPGTELYERYLHDGRREDIREVYEKEYSVRKINYTNFLYYLLIYNYPVCLVRFLIKHSSNGLYRLLNARCFIPLWTLVFYLLPRISGRIIKIKSTFSKQRNS